MASPDLSSYVPSRIGWVDGRPQVLWYDIGALDWTAPSFADTLEEAGRQGTLSESVETPLETLLEEARARPGLAPSGLIFHMARAGGREIAAGLNRSATTLVQVEPTALGDLFLYMDAFPREDFLLTLRALASVLGRPRRPEQRRYVIACWSALTGFVQVFRAAFPDARWIMAYRDPAEVLAALLRGPSGIALLQQTPEIPAQWLGIKPERIAALSPLEFTARFLRELCVAAADIGAKVPAGSFLAVDYRRLPDAIVEAVAPHFAVELSPDEATRIRTGYAAESETDGTAVLDEAAIRETATRLLGPVVRRLAALPQA